MMSQCQYGNSVSPVGGPGDDGTSGFKFFTRLAPAPRHVGTRIIWRLVVVGFMKRGAFGFAFGAMAMFVGLGFVIIGDPGNESFDNQYPPLVGWLLCCMGLCVFSTMVSLALADTRRLVRVFTWGTPVVGLIHRAHTAGPEKYQSYDQVLGQMVKHEESIAGMGLWSKFLQHSFSNWRVKFQLSGFRGLDQVIDGRMDFSSRISNKVHDPQVHLLVDDRHGRPDCIAPENFAWLGISKSGQLLVPGVAKVPSITSDHYFLKAVQVVVPTYFLSALGLVFGLKPLFTGADNSGISLVMGTVMVGVFTFTHGVAPMFVYRLFVDGLNLFGTSDPGTQANQLRPEPLARLLSGFSYLHMVIWYGSPILVLAALTSWLPLAWALFHILLAGRGRRWWLLLQHGSTSTALVLFILFFSGRHLFPLGVLVVLFQALLLTVVEWKGKQLWIRKEPDITKP